MEIKADIFARGDERVGRLIVERTGGMSGEPIGRAAHPFYNIGVATDHFDITGHQRRGIRACLSW